MGVFKQVLMWITFAWYCFLMLLHREYPGFIGGYEQLLRGKKVNFNSLTEWLDWAKSLHVKEIDLSLERVKEMAIRLDLLKPGCPVITVAGTNGKGSCVAGLEAIYLAAGYRIGAFTSPFLWRYNEQVRVQGNAVEDDLFCDAFQRITEKTDNIKLTPFELGTLAAFIIFRDAALDIWILEVGLGGRWDAVNVIDADVTIVSSIAIDHVDWLGNTRERIAREKAGIFRPNNPAVCGDFDPPLSLIEYANEIKAPLFCQSKHFGFNERDSAWDWWSENNCLENVAMPSLALQNMSTVLMAVDLLQKKRPVQRQCIDQAFKKVSLSGRIEVIPGDITHIYDVSHNPASAEFLATFLKKNPVVGKTHAVFSMLADKDIVSTIKVIQECINHWYVAPLAVLRGTSIDVLADSFQKANVNSITLQSSIKNAYDTAVKTAQIGDRIVVFGSFRTVAEVK